MIAVDVARRASRKPFRLNFRDRRYAINQTFIATPLDASSKTVGNSLMLSNPNQTGRGLASDAAATLAKRLDLAADLALHGPEHVGRELCAAIFLQHALLLARDERAKRSFLECLLLLRMESLLLQFLRACYGLDPTCSVQTSNGTDRTILGFPYGTRLVIAWAERGEHVTQRRRFAAVWSDRVLAELARKLPSGIGEAAEWEAVASC